MTFSISAISPTEILSDGGHKLEITGVFEAGHAYQVHIGDLGSISDPVCHSGIPGQAGVVVPSKATLESTDLDLLTVYSPRLTPSTDPYSVFVLDVGTAAAQVLSDAITAAKYQYFTTVYATRKIQHPKYKVGSRNIELEATAELDVLIDDYSLDSITDDETGELVTEG